MALSCTSLIVMASSVLMVSSITTISESRIIHSDLIVAVGDRLDLVTANGTTGLRVQLPSYNASKIVALAYDPLTGKLFFSDTKKMQGHIFSFRFSLVDEQPLTKDDTVLDIVEMVDNKESVEGLSYDSVEETLTWTDGLKGSVRRVRIDHDRIGIQDTNSIEVVHLLENDKPRSLISDPCTRMLYWVNWNQENRHSIERSFINGSNRQTIVRKNLIMPHGLGLDVRHQKLYWANNMRSSLYQIERSDVDGSKREMIHRGRSHFIYGLTVGEDYIYWTDREEKTLWALPKEGSSQSRALRKYQQEPLSVIVFQQLPLDCSQIDISTMVVEDDMVPPPPQECSTEGYCFNGGKCVVADGSATNFHCSCLGNYGGQRCEELLTEPSSRPCRMEEHCPQIQIAASLDGSRPTLSLVIGLSVVCFILMVVVLYLTLWLRRLLFSPSSSRSVSAGFKRRKLVEDSPNNDVENFNTVFKLSEKQESSNNVVMETTRDTVNLLNYEEF